MGRAAGSFEELHIYQKARELVNGVYTVTRRAEFSRDYGLVNQIRKAAVSIMSNIAEGFERGAKTEFVQFLFIAKGSCGEVRAQLQIASDQGYVDTQEYERLVDTARRTGAMISNFIARLQESSYQGGKFARPQRRSTCAAKEADGDGHSVQVAKTRRARRER